MQNAGDFKLLGEFIKTHGISGHLVLKLSFFAEEELKEGDTVFVEVDGIPVPFFIGEFRFLGDFTALVRFDDTETAQQAEILTGCSVYCSPGYATEEAEKEEGYGDITGFRVLDREKGYSGILQEVIEYPDNPVMRLDHDGAEILIPFHDDIVLNIDHSLRVIEISAPEGLLDLYL